MSPRKQTRRKEPAFTGRIDRIERETPLTLGVLADTHLRQADADRLPGEILDLFRRFHVDLIVHAGDIVHRAILDRLEIVAPVIAVSGNNEPLELWQELPERIELTVGTHRIGIVHGHGGETARKTAKVAFPDGADLVIYGHSHIPMIEEIDGVVFFNPGSPIDRRWARHFGIGIVTIDGRGMRPELILFDAPAHLVSIEPVPAPGEYA